MDFVVIYTDIWGDDRIGPSTTKSIARRTAKRLKADGCTEVFVRPVNRA